MPPGFAPALPGSRRVPSHIGDPRVSDSCDPMDCRLPGSSVHGVSQARIPGFPQLVPVTSGRSAAGAGRTRAAQGGCRLLAGVGEGFPVVLSEMATAAGNPPGAEPGWGKPGLHRSRFRSLWVGGRSLLCSRGSPIWLGTRRAIRLGSCTFFSDFVVHLADHQAHRPGTCRG